MSDCTKCGHEINGRPNFCPACGASLTYDSGGTDPLVGRTIGGSFHVEHLVGEGAMGRVYQAENIQLKKKVALKVLRSNLVSDHTVVARFEREAHAASRLNHPNCISIFGFGKEDDGDLLWMAMEFIEGRDLGEIISEDSPLPTARIAHIIGQVCLALDEAHAANIIHRDLKPANVVCYDHRRTKDFVKVLDFGIAKITDPGEDYQPLTRDGIVCGTPAYMSPEQVQGLELDNRSDLFSLGIILYQTLTGNLPFYAESAVEVATKIVIEDPQPPSKVQPDWAYPKELEALTLKLLSKKKEERFANAMEVKEALDRVMEQLKARHDISLEMNPDEVASLLHDVGGDVEGAATLQLSSDVIAQAMAAEGLVGKPSPSSGGSTMPESGPSPVVEVASDLRPEATEPTRPEQPPSITRTFDEAPPQSADRPKSSTGMIVGVGVALVAAAAAGAWFMFSGG